MSYLHNHNPTNEARTDCPGCLEWDADILKAMADIAAGRTSTFVSWDEFEAHLSTPSRRTPHEPEERQGERGTPPI